MSLYGPDQPARTKAAREKFLPDRLIPEVFLHGFLDSRKPCLHFVLGYLCGKLRHEKFTTAELNFNDWPLSWAVSPRNRIRVLLDLLDLKLVTWQRLPPIDRSIVQARFLNGDAYPAVLGKARKAARQGRDSDDGWRFSLRTGAVFGPKEFDCLMDPRRGDLAIGASELVTLWAICAELQYENVYRSTTEKLAVLRGWSKGSRKRVSEHLRKLKATGLIDCEIGEGRSGGFVVKFNTNHPLYMSAIASKNRLAVSVPQPLQVS